MCRPCHVIGQLFQWLAETSAPIAPIWLWGLVKDSLIRRISSSSSRRSPGSWMSLTETTIADRQQPPASKQGKKRVRGAAGVAWPLRANRLTTCGSFGLLDFFLLPGRRIPLILPVMPWNLTASHGPQPTPMANNRLVSSYRGVTRVLPRRAMDAGRFPLEMSIVVGFVVFWAG